VGQGGPAALQADLEDSAEDSTCRLSDIDHVGDKRKAVELELGDVGLQKNIDLS
jgi:hypothetical protein